MAATYEPIATTTLGSAAASITFSSISSAYTDLRVALTCSTNVSNTILIQFNGNAGTLYSQTYLGGNGSSALSGSGTSQTSIYYSNLTNTYTSTPQFLTVDIFSYAGSTNKTALLTVSADNNGSGITENNVGLWRSTSAITSVSFTVGGTRTFNTGTTATLYGIKAA